MHVFEIQGDRTLFASEDMHSYSHLGCEIDVGSAEWDFGVGKEHSSAQFHVRSQCLATSEIPLHHEGIDGNAIGCIHRAGDHINRNQVAGVLQVSAEPSPAQLASEDLPQTQASVKDSSLGDAAADGVSTL